MLHILQTTLTEAYISFPRELELHMLMIVLPWLQTQQCTNVSNRQPLTRTTSFKTLAKHVSPRGMAFK